MSKFDVKIQPRPVEILDRFDVIFDFIHNVHPLTWRHNCILRLIHWHFTISGIILDNMRIDQFIYSLYYLLNLTSFKPNLNQSNASSMIRMNLWMPIKRLLPPQIRKSRIFLSSRPVYRKITKNRLNPKLVKFNNSKLC